MYDFSSLCFIDDYVYMINEWLLANEISPTFQFYVMCVRVYITTFEVKWNVTTALIYKDATCM